MSGVEPEDPLGELRRADSRTLKERVGERNGGLPAMRRASWSTVGWSLLAIAVLAVVARSLLSSNDPPIEDRLPFAQPDTAVEAAVVMADGPAQSAEVVVHIAGAVSQPGLVQADEGWRVADAIAAAGGPLVTADLDRVNLAARVQDGVRLYIPELGEGAVPTVVGESAAGGASSGPINLNSADAAALEQLPGVGPATAATIVAHREEHGAFATVDALVAVRGIGAAKLEAMRDFLVVG